MAFRVFKGNGNSTGDDPAPQDSADQLAPVLERLEALTTALEGLEGGDGGDTVLNTLTRMERRDIQTFSAIDTFATALKSLSHHLSHLRQTIHGDSAKLDGLAARLEGIEGRIEAGLMNGLEVDFGPMAVALDTIAQRIVSLEAKLDGMAQQQSHWPFDADAFATALAGIADRLARVEAKVDSVAQQPALEPEATANLLNTLVQRLGSVEQKVDSGADGTSIAACLLAVDRRLSRIETGLGMDRPLPSVEEIPDLADVIDGEPSPVASGATETANDDSEPAPEPGTRDVDQLLEQVFKVLAR